ncbi:phosphoribosylglycinamide formyltransferase 1 [Bacteroidales bacterium]|nr:phosphoribosylglycinamide formyltransferase 1 [Bacteroidales bacterium]
MNIKVAIFASGSGSNAENIVSYFNDKEWISIPFIISNKAEAFVHQRAKAMEIKSFSFCKKEDFENGCVLKFLKERNIDFIVLAGFLLKIPENLIDAFPNKIINIHPALLPKYGGKGMYGDRVHQAAIDAGEMETGISIHLVNEQYDQGRILFQASCPIDKQDAVLDVAKKVHELEYKYFPKVLEEYFKNGVTNKSTC